MATRGLPLWSAGCLGILTCLTFMTPAVGDDNSDGTGTKEAPAGCPSSQIDRYLMFVSTMDGRVSALNVGKEGQVEWSVDAGSSLVSSSIGNIEMMRDGIKTRLIPSLDGALYQFDGESVEALPFTADTLLSSSFKFTDDSTIVGGKEASTYGIDPATGKLKYACSIGGCKKFTDDGASHASQDVLIVTRNTKTVRSVEMNSGSEKWNFSVGQHQLKFVGGTDSFYQITEGTDDLDEEVFIQTCPDQEEERDWFDFSWMLESPPEVELRVVVPKGLVMAFSKADPSQLLWQRKFESSISSAWVLQKGELSEMSLFDEKFVPALGMEPDEEELSQEELKDVTMAPLMYIGLHEGQMYVQPSVQLVDEVESTIKKGTTTSVAVMMPRVRWKPYIATAGSRTPAEVRPRNPLQITDESLAAANGDRDSWQDQYPFDGGFYLFPDQTPVALDPFIGNRTEQYSMRLSAMLWWKEVGVLSVFVAIMIHLFFHKLVNRKTQPTAERVRVDSTSIANQITELQEKTVVAETPKQEEHMSRYYSEFLQLACLGRGGFGVVFEAANRMDDCKYAVKRITLNDSDKARERVMREVKALAKLDNGGIVRYYQAWFESPPPGWQEERDKLSLDTESITSTPMITSTGLRSQHTTPKHSPLHTPVKQPTILNFNQRNPFKMDSTFDRSKPFGGVGDQSLESDSEWAKSQAGKKGASDGFLPRLAHSAGDSLTVSESGSYCDHSLHLHAPEDSSSVNFVDSSVSKSHSIHVPFSLYLKSDCPQAKANSISDYENSVSVIFEDSGCAEKSTTEELSSSSSKSNSSAQQNVMRMEQGVRRSRSRSKPCRRSKSCDSVSSSSVKQSKLSKSLDDTWTSSKHKPPANLDLFTTHDEINKKNMIVPTPTRKLYLYIQMQLCQRATLKDWMIQNSEHRDPIQLLDIMDQIVCAVDYIHSTGLMHRDLKPSNIFFSLDGVVKVGDFGLVTEAEDQCIEPELSCDTSSPFRKHTDQVGTKLYMSPEQARGGIYSEKVDIFALGVIFFEMFFPFGTQMERVNTLMRVRQLDFPARFLKEKLEEHALVRQMLSAEPETRPSTKEILQNPLLGQFETVRQVLKSRRTTNRSISTSSSSSS